MRLKQGVSLAGLKRVMRAALIAADDIWERNGKELEVIAHMDGAHSAHSVHYYGFALDFSTATFDEESRRVVFQDLDHRLRPYFKCLQRPKHVHVEYKFWLDCK